MNSRELATQIVDNILNNGAFSNVILSQELNKSNLEDKDKALVTEIVYGTVKYKYTIDKILIHFLENGFDRLEPQILNILRTAIYQLRYLDKVPEFAAVNEAVNLAKDLVNIGASKLVNGVLRNYLRNSDDSKYYKAENPVEVLCFTYSFPKWMVELFIYQYGMETTEKILIGLNNVPEVTVRVNNLKISYEDAFKELTELGYNLKKGYVSPEAIKITKGRSIEKNPLFISGKITAQDESAMLVAASMDIKENQLVMDLCSAPGGKTTHISELMNNTGAVKAFDLHDYKINLVKQNSQRLGITNIEFEVMDATSYNTDYLNIADSVLVDVPCSGLGIIRKKPEIKWNKNNTETRGLKEIQKKIIINASQYVKTGGVLLYSTCTLNKKENEENIKYFLKKRSNFKLEPLYFGDFENILYSEEGYATILPNEAMDGFFIAKLRKI